MVSWTAGDSSGYCIGERKLVATSEHDEADRFSRDAAQFRTTRWSVILAAGQEDDTGRHGAMEELCRSYWYPVYAFIRRWGYSPEDAQDLTQGFFAHLLESDTVAAARKEKGRFRSFLLGALKNYLGYEARKQSTLKRGGGTKIVPIDDEEGEDRYLQDLAHDAAPDKLYLRSWADALLASTLDQLRGDYERAGKRQLFDQLSPHLSGTDQDSSYRELSDNLGMSVGAVTMSVYRMRKRYGELLREQIAHTVNSPEEIDDEIACLFAALET